MMIKDFVEGNVEIWKYLYEMPAKDWLVILGILFGFAVLQELFILIPRYIRMRKMEKKHASLRVIRQAISDGLIKLPDDV